MERLISMTEFVFQEIENSKEHPQTHLEDSTTYLKIFNYANFLSQKLSLEMFVPCKLVDGVWVVLEEPTPKKVMCWDWDKSVKEYQEAKDRVLFEGVTIEDNPQFPNFIPLKLNGVYFKSWDIKNNEFYNSYNWVIEKLIFLNLELTPTAKKLIGLN